MLTAGEARSIRKRVIHDRLEAHDAQFTISGILAKIHKSAHNGLNECYIERMGKVESDKLQDLGYELKLIDSIYSRMYRHIKVSW